MGFKCGFLALLCVFMNVGSILTVELTVTCNIITNDYCFIDKQIQLGQDDTLKFIVDNADSIKALDIIQESKLVTIPTGIFKTFPSMEKLFVSDLGISVLLPNRFDGAERLRALNIYNNRIEVIPSRVFRSLTAVEEILLMSNAIETIEDNAFDGMVNLDTLKLDNNRIKSLTRLAFSGAPKIRVLLLGGNNIETIEDGTFTLPKLEQLHITNNKLKMLSDSFLIGAPNLQRIYLDDNAITRVGMAFSDCNNLMTLGLNKNPIEDIRLSSLTTLKSLNTLYLANTNFRLPEEVPAVSVTESKLKTILLSGNGLTSPDILRYLSIFGNLEEIYLMNNTFTTINDMDKIKNYFPQIKRLALAKNEPSLCKFIKDNEQFLKKISVWSTTADGTICRSADFQADNSFLRE